MNPSNEPSTPSPRAPENGRGRLPALPRQLVQTDRFRFAFQQFRKTALERDITAFDGRAGTGKTTCVAWCARQVPTSFRYFQLPQRARPEMVTAAAYEAVFDRKARGTEREQARELVETLAHQDIGLLADEVHAVGVPGMQQLRYIWDEVQRERQGVDGFPMVLIGSDVTATAESAAELRSRIARTAWFLPIDGQQEIVQFASELHPRLRATTPKRLESLNEKIAGGSLRVWIQIAKELKYLPAGGGATAGLTKSDEDDLALMLGRGTR